MYVFNFHTQNVPTSDYTPEQGPFKVYMYIVHHSLFYLILLCMHVYFSFCTGTFITIWHKIMYMYDISPLSFTFQCQALYFLIVEHPCPSPSTQGATPNIESEHLMETQTPGEIPHSGKSLFNDT